MMVEKESRTGRGTCLKSEVVGTVHEWRYETTGAWYASNGDPSILNADGKLLLLRLLLKRVDGEITDIIMDDLTNVAKLEAK